jgi:hypothetical protein
MIRMFVRMAAEHLMFFWMSLFVLSLFRVTLFVFFLMSLCFLILCEQDLALHPEIMYVMHVKGSVLGALLAI